MTSKEPRVYLHMGMGHTGSSALQVAFVRNRDALAAVDTVYPISQSTIEAVHSDRVGSAGNSRIVRRLLMDDAGGPKDARSALERRIENTGSHHVLFSSEVLFRARSKNLERLIGLLDQLGRPLHPILYVRNIAGHALLSYGQRIKGSGATDTLAEYCMEKYRPNYRTTLEKLLGVVTESAISVVHYDSERENLFIHFLREVLGAPTTTRIDDPGDRRVNRSLTSGEMEILRRINAAVRTRTGSRLLSASLEEFPWVHDETSIPREVVSVLHDRFGDEVQWVNRHFFNDSRLTVASPEVAITDDDLDLMDLEPMQRVLLGLVASGTSRVAK